MADFSSEPLLLQPCSLKLLPFPTILEILTIFIIDMKGKFKFVRDLGDIRRVRRWHKLGAWEGVRDIGLGDRRAHTGHGD